MFVSNHVMSFNEIWRKRLYNFKRVTKSNNIVVNHVYHVIFYTTMCECMMIFMGRIEVTMDDTS